MNHLGRWSILLLALIAGCGLFKPGPGATVKHFYRAVQEGHIDEAVMLISADVRARTGDAKMRAIIANAARTAQAQGNTVDIEINNEDVHGDLATVAFTEKSSTGAASRQDTMPLVRENGEWKLAPKGGK